MRRGILVSVLVCAFAVQGARAERHYTVRRGDTLTRIAHRFHVSVAEIREANRMGRRSSIREGEELAIPDGAYARRPSNPERAPRSYTVRRGDTLARIARRFRVTISELRAANRMGRRSRIRTGEELRIPGPGGPPGSPARRPRPNLRGRVGSVALALALLSNPPPRRILRRAGFGPEVPSPLRFPSPSLRIGRGFGSGRGGRHKALDIAARVGDRVRAAHRGFVVFSGWFLGYGRSVLIVHRGGAVTLYAHLSRTLVRTGTRVARGRVIGRAGSTGNSRGPHLHFALFVNGRAVDPAPLLDPQPRRRVDRSEGRETVAPPAATEVDGDAPAAPEEEAPADPPAEVALPAADLSGNEADVAVLP